MSEHLPGLDLTALTPWFVDHVGAVGDGLTAEHIAGGKSNLTYRLRAGTGEWILRRPPVGKLLATAHDMGREYRMMSALAGTAVPVPQMYGYCDDADVLGAPFYVMESVAGTPYRRAKELQPLGAERTRAISERLIDTLAAVHAVDPAAVGLADFGRAEGFLGRQVSRWRSQFDAAHTRDLPDMIALHEALAARVPADGAPGIVHGDYRLDNVLFDADDRPAAVIDWELSTIGDSLTDVALMCVYDRMGKLSPGAVSDVAAAPGYLDEHEVLSRYAAGSDRDLSDFGFYVGLACFKLAGIVEGIHYRYVNGQTVGAGFAGVGDSVHPLLAAGLAALRGQ
ncbi:phosphotransferase family protein [Gordonia alkaliphila]|uniref:Phosphotransferase family protein n=1 Tax=Gordonia alkaliphila TaxID=1053547 RepID=A0ABP8Z068_9ACTN